MIVVDASAVVDALSGLPGGQAVRNRLVSDELQAPTLIDYEVVNALRGMTLRGELGATRADDVLTDFEDLPIHRWQSADVLRRGAFRLRDRVSAYDAAYVVLAEALDCLLITRDARLARTTGHEARIELL